MEILSNISPLPFYTDISEQHHRKPYMYGQIHPVITEYDRVLPFQFIIQGGKILDDFNYDFSSDFAQVVVDRAAINSVKAHSLDGREYDITKAMIYAGLSAQDIGNGLRLVKHKDLGPALPAVPPGLYYLSILIGRDMVYSDVFVTCQDTENHLKLEYYNAYNLEMAKGYIDFSGDFRFRVYLDAELGKPEYLFEEEATSRGGYTFIESQISKKTYRFVCPGTESLCDALRLVRLCTNKTLTSRHKSYELLTFSMNPSWEDYGDVASIECEFDVDNIIQNIGNLK